MEMQCDLLVRNLKNPKTIALVKENIRHISDGSSSHCAGTLDLVLEKAFQPKKQAKVGPSPSVGKEVKELSRQNKIGDSSGVFKLYFQ
jgi:hypothetical protein